MKKKVLLVFAHPNHESLNYAILQNIQSGLQAAGHESTLLDLYQEQFDPVLSFNKENRRRDLQYRPELEPYREQIRWADHLVFIFPIWWGGMPAILKGYFDKVFSTGFSYHFENLLPRGHLNDKSAWIITTDDTPSPFRFLALQDYGSLLKRQILSIMTGVRVKKHLRLSYLKGKSQKQIEQWLCKCYRLGKEGLGK